MNTSKLSFIHYNEDTMERVDVSHLDELNRSIDHEVKWLEVHSSQDEHLIKEIGSTFHLHPLVIEDILTDDHLPKLEEYDTYLFLILKGMTWSDSQTLESYSFSLVLFNDSVLSFQSTQLGVFETVVTKLQDGTRMRKNQADDLLYALTDTIVDGYFPLIEKLGEKIDELEDTVLVDPSKELLQAIHNIKKDLIYIRKTLWSMRNAVNNLSKNDYEWIDEKTRYYFRDVYDDIIQLIDLTETYREICSGILDTYLSSVGNKTNEIMKILTVYSAIFIPLTFLAGVYGMNFHYFPELDWPYGYLAFWLVSILITGIMLLLFKKKKWF